jgi:hypothetical protein
MRHYVENTDRGAGFGNSSLHGQVPLRKDTTNVKKWR